MLKYSNLGNYSNLRPGPTQLSIEQYHVLLPLRRRVPQPYSLSTHLLNFEENENTHDNDNDSASLNGKMITKCGI